MKNPKYKGIKIIRELDTIPLVKKIIRDFNPELILEIGTAFGGLALVFHEACPSAELHTYDPIRKPTKRELFGPSVYFHNEDAFKSKGLVQLCKSDKRKFLFCDGFDKKRELLTFAPLLNRGDMVGVHDYPTRLWRDWKFGMKWKKLERVFHPDIIELWKDFRPIEENKEFERLQKESNGLKNYGDRYWIKEK
jgi:hypothetical protein